MNADNELYPQIRSTEMNMTLDQGSKALVELGHVLKGAGYSFATVTPATHARVNARKGNEWAKDLSGIFGWSRPFQTAIVDKEVFGLMQSAGILQPYQGGWRCTLRAATLRDQLYFHSAYPTDEADAVFFGPDTYRFADAIARYLAAHASKLERAIDVGCGAGPGAIVIAKLRPETEVLATDINGAALRLAQVNAVLAGASLVKPRLSNLLNDVDGSFDLIVANPPYLADPRERAYRHGAGKFGEGLSLAILDSAMKRLSLGGSLLLYTGAAIVDGVDIFRKEVEKKLLHHHAPWQYNEIDPDVFGEELLEPAYSEVDRIAAVLLLVSR